MISDGQSLSGRNSSITGDSLNQVELNLIFYIFLRETVTVSLNSVPDVFSVWRATAMLWVNFSAASCKSQKTFFVCFTIRCLHVILKDRTVDIDCKILKKSLFEGRKELAHSTVRLQMILFSKITGVFCSEHLVDFSTYLLHRFTALLAL